MPELPHGAEALSNLVERVLGWGIEVPTVPALLRPALAVQSEWHWGSQPFDPFEHYYEPSHLRWLLTEWDRRPLYLFSHSGHGINSYSVNATLSIGRLAVYVQSLFGGVYGDPRLDAAQANLLFRRVDSLMRGLRVAEPVRWLLVSSAFRQVCMLVDLEEFDRLGNPSPGVDNFEQNEALPWHRDDEQDLFGSAEQLRYDVPTGAPFVQSTGDASVVGAMAEMKADDPIIDTWLLRELGKEISTALGTAEVDGEQWIFFADEDDAVLALWEGGGDFWEIIGRYPSFAELLRHIGPRLDERWSRIPVDDADRPRPIVVIAKERGVRVLHRTESGVQAAEQLARDPGKLIVDGTSWSIFSEATNHEAGELEAEQ